MNQKDKYLHVKIETGIPIPVAIRPGRKPVYPFRNMEIGESFLLDANDKMKIYNAAFRFGKRHNMKFLVSNVSDESCRCWRIE